MKKFLKGVIVGVFVVKPLSDLCRALFANIIGRLLYIPPVNTAPGNGMYHPTYMRYR